MASEASRTNEDLGEDDDESSKTVKESSTQSEESGSLVKDRKGGASQTASVSGRASRRPIASQAGPPVCDSSMPVAQPGERTDYPDRHDGDTKVTAPTMVVSRLQAEQGTPASKTPKCSHNNAMPSMEQRTLCQNCSRSMLSYIEIMQRFLNSLAEDVNKRIDPLSRCVECIKEDICQQKLLESPAGSTSVNAVAGETVLISQTSNISSARRSKESSNKSDPDLGFSPRNTGSEAISSTSETGTIHPNCDIVSEQMKTGTIEPGRNIGPNPTEETARQTPLTEDKNVQRLETLDAEPNTPEDQVYRDNAELHTGTFSDGEPTAKTDTNKTAPVRPSEWNREANEPKSDAATNAVSSNPFQNQSYVRTTAQEQPFFQRGISHNQTVNDLQIDSYGRPLGSSNLQINMSAGAMDSSPTGHGFHVPSSPQFPHGGSVDGILSTLYRLERGLQDVSKGPTVWQRLAELQTGSAAQTPGRVRNEAFVTLARNNADVLGCLVLGASLLLCGTSRTICILVSDEVSTNFMAPLSSIFHDVVHIRSLESLGTTKLSLLDQPELGICFSKLNIWRLEQFQKCVFLSADTLVVQNCDELFCHEELSAVPDIGWPDCFNSAVFVYKPSIHTFWQLLDFAEKQGSYDGGDQGLLNAYFNSWSQDIHKRLSFIYNLMANVSYTYTPAFKQFGRNVKIVQFMGAFKPWHVKFYSSSGQIASSTSVHPTYVQFVYVWLCVFRVSVLPLLSQEIQSYASSQNIISAHELLRFYPTDTDSDVEFLLAPPSVRLRPTEPTNVLDRLSLPLRPSQSDALLTDLPLTPDTPDIDLVESCRFEQQRAAEDADDAFVGKPPESGVAEEAADNITSEQLLNEANEGAEAANLLPGSEVGDYQGMSAWEQGRMDYEGDASSDAIIKRLHFLMENKDRLI